ncbi:MAG: hypothetical protein AVDCRST_MAG71-1908 [uncultured Lysobacter sp.]|uniref:Lipoprotein n=1 Tax=uncultured Lysobacter sp. TaxID=271060 RepID=A0A6J4LJX7_9GAMM|nr:MAG: hypothetical protein AVDCRST_MAG71-1908 [uncultured Lysobacter sp.]
MKLVSALYCSISLIGCSVSGSTFITRDIDNGTDVLYSKARANDGVARFECRSSESGQCFYTVFAHDCRSADGAGVETANCTDAPLRRFSVPAGSTHELSGLDDFRLCVSTKNHAVAPDCKPVHAVAAQ